MTLRNCVWLELKRWRNLIAINAINGDALSWLVNWASTLLGANQIIFPSSQLNGRTFLFCQYIRKNKSWRLEASDISRWSFNLSCNRIRIGALLPLGENESAFAYRVLDYGKAFGDVPMASQVDTERHIVQLALPIEIWNPICKSKTNRSN